MAQSPPTGPGSVSVRGQSQAQTAIRGRRVRTAPSATGPPATSASPSLPNLSRPLETQGSSPLSSAWRGGQRSRGRSRGGSMTSRTPYAVREPERPITEYIGNLICDVTLDPDPKATYPAGAVEHVTQVASYNWVDAVTPTIAVPGSPAVWVNKKMPLTCEQDKGMVYVNQAAFRCPDSPLTPLVECVRYWDPEFDFGTMDIVTDRNNLRKLLAWAQGSPTQFRIDLQRAGSGTVLFMRWQPQTRLLSQPVYSSSFKHAVTRPGGEHPSEGYHGIVSYDFGELNLLVRFEVDACYGASSSPAAVDDLVSMTRALSLSKTSTTESERSEPYKSNGIQIIRSGDKMVEQKDLIELATRSAGGRQYFEWLSKYPQLYLSNTPTFILGVHDRGTFTRVENFAADDTSNEEIRRARKDMQPGLNKLAVTLGEIRDKVLELTDGDATGDRSGRLLALVCQDRKLALFERTNGPKLPENLVQLFE